MKRIDFLIALLLCCAVGCSGKGEPAVPEGGDGGLSEKLTVNPTLQAHMVMQQNKPFTISGTGTAGQYVEISCSWEGKPGRVQVSADGSWQYTVTTPEGGFDAQQVTVSGKQTFTFDNILVGEVWVCSGQSNMWWPLKDAEGGLSEMIGANASLPIRLLHVPQEQASAPVASLSARWQPCTAGSLEWFSAVAYFFGKQLVEALQVPVGLINASWGDTTAEVWAERDAVLANDAIREQALKQDATPRADAQAPYRIGSAFHAMIYPLRDIPVAGAIWYQGESNMDAPGTYPELLATLATSWRKLWKAEAADFPFYVAQICPYERVFDYRVPYANPAMRFAQQQASKLIANSGVICNDDIGDIHNIHPRNKQDVGKRFAFLALEEKYGKAGQPRSPIYAGHRINGRVLEVDFSYAGAGLETADCMSPTYFEVAGADRIFHPATAEISGHTVRLTAAAVPEPAFARLGWSYTHTTNLRGKGGLPVSVFKTYDWVELTEEP
ncbi:MAG: hypothetical protein EAS52_15490 [Parapedobacter sp.]|nr:MAG: hypothetical protein EAS52_15490 [Parapedobacter sp.]